MTSMVGEPVTLDTLQSLFASLGNALAADVYRWLGMPDPAERSDTERCDDIYALVNSMPAPSRAKHDDECWRRHVPCFAERIGELLK